MEKKGLDKEIRILEMTRDYFWEVLKKDSSTENFFNYCKTVEDIELLNLKKYG